MSLQNAFRRLLSEPVRCGTIYRLYIIHEYHDFIQNYQLASKIDSQQGPINCLAVIGDGELLASGGNLQMLCISILLELDHSKAMRKLLKYGTS